MKRLEGNGCKISYVVIEKFLLVFTVKSEGLHSWIRNCFFKSTNLQWTPFSKTARLYNCDETGITIVPHKHIRTERQASDIFSSVRRSGIFCKSSNVRVQLDTSFLRYLYLQEKYETRTDEWHAAWVNPRMPSLGVDTERDFYPVVSSFHQTYKADKK